MRRLAGTLALGLVVGAFAWRAGPARAEPDGLVFPRDQQVVGAARAYFDETVDRWIGRKQFRAALEKLTAVAGDPVKDLDLMLEVLYQGRSFQQDFSDKTWQKDNDVKAFVQRGPYRSILSSRLRFTYALPPTYPTRMQLSRTPRPGPLPLLFVFHEEKDYTGDEKSHPGENVLKRWWPEAEFGPVYQDWMMLAPAAPRAKFLEENGTIRHDRATEVFAQLWKRYHVDFDRVVLDGSDAALAMAAAQPVFFAGLVLRGGTPDPTTVSNFASLPVYVVGNEALKRDLEAAGHPNVTLGEAAGLPEWLAKQKRTLPTKFSWTMSKRDQVLAHWVSIEKMDPSAPERRLAVEVDREANRIEINAEGVITLDLFLNDRIVDLDREVEVVVNGYAEKKNLERDFDRLLDKEPIKIRQSMYLGWLFPTTVRGIVVGGPATSAAPAEPPAPDPRVPEAVRYQALVDFLLGRPDRTAAALREAPVAEDAWPAALVDLWWRPRGEPDDIARNDGRVRELDAAMSGDGMGGLYRWLALRDAVDPPESPPTNDPHPAYAAVAADRMARERAGLSIVSTSPLQALRQDREVGENFRWFLDDVQAPAYRGPRDDPASPAALRAARAGARNLGYACGAVVALVLGALALAYTLRPMRHGRIGRSV